MWRSGAVGDINYNTKTVVQTYDWRAFLFPLRRVVVIINKESHWFFSKCDYLKTRKKEIVVV